MAVSIEIIRADGSFVPLVEIERLVIMSALESTNNWLRSAKQLGIGRSTLYRRIKDLGLESFADELRKQRERVGVERKPRISRAALAAAKAEEKLRIEQALQITAQVHRLCLMLSMDEKTLKAKMRRHGFCLSKSRKAILRRLNEESERHKGNGTLLVQIAA